MKGLKGLKDYVLNDDNWNPGRQGNERGRKIGRLELLDRLLATAGWYVFDMCAGPQILVFLLFLLLLNAAELIRNPLRNVWTAYLAIMCAQLVNAFLRRTYFTDGYRIYHPFGTLMVVGLLVMATSVTLMARAHDDDPSGGSTNHLLLVQLIAAYVVSVVQLFSV